MPSRYYKILVPVLVVIVALGIAYTASYHSLHAPSPTTSSTVVASSSPSLQQASSAARVSTSHAPVAQAPVIKSSIETSGASQNVVVPTPNTNISATFVVNGESSSLSVAPGTTVEQAMSELEQQNKSFTFTEQNYPGIGEFVTAIDGKPSANSFYWFLYVNGQQSQMGASETIIHAGDTIEWKYQQ